MVKYLAVVVALVGSLAISELAEARGRRGCSSCGTGGGCPGGVCYTTVAPEKSAYSSNAPVAPIASTNGTAQPVVAATTSQTAPRYYNASSSRRGLFGWRR